MSLRDVDWGQHDLAVSQTVRGLSERFLIDGPERKVATPENFRPVLEWLDRLTKRLPVRAFDESQLATDIGRWKMRMREYGKAQRAAEAADPREITSADYGKRVVLPLLLGWYPGAMEQRSPDVITPLSLAFQAQVADDTMREAWRRLVDDLEKNAKVAGGSIAGTLIAAGLAVGVGKFLLSKNDG